MAVTIAKGLTLQQDHQTLIEATLILREAGAACEAARRRRYSGSRPNRDPRTDKEKVREQWLRASALEWRVRNPRLTQSAGWSSLCKQAKKQKVFDPWPNPQALRSWANRKGIRL
jgi:hypothetical protein